MRHRAQDRRRDAQKGLREEGRDLFQDFRMYSRFVLELPRYLAQKDTVEGGRALLEERLANREQNFLRIAERAIYGYEKSPYLPLLRAAGCEFGDLRKMAAADGLEETLRTLRQADVYIRFEEFKGREPLTRNGSVSPISSDDFNNPFLKRHFDTESGGSTGVGTRNPQDLDHKAAKAPVSMLVKSLQGILDLPRARVGGRLPFGMGPPGWFAGARQGHVAERWFVPVMSEARKPEMRYRFAHHYMVTMARIYGVKVPKPEPLRLEDVVEVAYWAAETLQARGPCSVHCTPSMALRICIAAREAGVDLTGAVFVLGGEPLTEAKMAGITATGARAFANYHMSEVGLVGAACMRPHGVNDHHLMLDHLGVIQWPRRVGDTEVDPLLLTSLLPTSPRILLNVEIDDYGVIEDRLCACPLDELGLHTHVRDVRSFGKLTAEGVTLVGTEMEHVLESVLPSRFGGSALDYQLVEEEDEQGFTRICLNVSPSVALEDEMAVIDTVLGGLDKASLSSDLAARLWNETGAIRIRRVEPVMSGRGKLLPLRSDHRRPLAATGQEGRA